MKSSTSTRTVDRLYPRARSVLLGCHQSEPRPCSEALGNQEKDPARIEEAIAAHRDALKEWTHKLWPKEWAATQMNLGLALATLSKQEDGMAQLEEAVAAYREALKVNFRKHWPQHWA
jgi:tetratricopeptide (TPR) repeat protein